MKTPFEIVSYYADIYLRKSACAKSIKERKFYLDIYYNYIGSCGWSKEDFEQELMKRIDKDWEPMYN